GCALRCATPPAPKSTPGPLSRRSRRWSRSTPCRSVVALHRRPPRATMCRCASSPAATRSQAPAEAAVARILIAEDEEPVRALVARALTEDGHSVVTAADGAEGLDKLKDQDGNFDLLLADIKMPVMDGIALALAAARDYPGLPILLMTGYAEQRERASGLEALVTSIIAKPFSLAEIKFAVAA